MATTSTTAETNDAATAADGRARSNRANGPGGVDAPPGLEGLVVAETAIGDVRGDEGTYHYRGHDAPALARDHDLDDVWHLFVLGHLPDTDERDRFQDRVLDARSRLPGSLLDRLAPGDHGAQLAGGRDRVAGLRSAWSLAAEHLGCRPWLDLDPGQRLDDAVALVAAGPVLVAAMHRPGVSDELSSLPAGTAAAYLQLVQGGPAPDRSAAALDRYLVLTIDHGLNASTFTARTVTSTGADLGAVLFAALGALSGPLHGGAPSRVLEMLEAIGTADRAEAWVREALARKQRIMGFGHRIYRTEDPRARLLRETAATLGGERAELALHVEEVIRQVLREAHPDRVLDVNVEYHAAVVLEAVGLPRELFTPTFAISRSIGWMAHALEQMERNRIVRPTARYVGTTTDRAVATAAR